jgi:cysteinyl-tRNA synthetase
MARKYLGQTFDIHGGGIDNIFPHNECEIAQSECANDVDFARYWMLVGSLNVADEEGIPVKMSKSLGNFVTIKDALAQYRPEAIRMFALGAHYSSPVTYGEDPMESAASGWERLYNATRLVRQMMNTAPESDEGNSFLAQVEQVKADFKVAMDDDFNAPKAIATLQEFTREVNSLLNSEAGVGIFTLNAIHAVYKELGGDVLGIIPESDVVGSGDSQREGKLIEMLIAMRAQARAEKDYAESDRIRDELAKLGIVLEDRADGTIWRVI